MKLIVLPLSKARQYTSDKPWGAISIVTFKGDMPKLSSENRQGLLQLLFKDTDFERQEGVFQEEQALQILDFVDSMFGKVDHLLIHCEAGRSRSPAVAAAISKIYANDDMHWFRYYTPNMLVYRRILNVALQKYPELADKIVDIKDSKLNPNFTTLL